MCTSHLTLLMMCVCSSIFVIMYLSWFFFISFFFSSRRRHTRCLSDWSSDVCSSDLTWIPALRPPRCQKARKSRFAAALVAPPILAPIPGQQSSRKHHHRHRCRYRRHSLAVRPQDGRDEIGRASCRERV